MGVTLADLERADIEERQWARVLSGALNLSLALSALEDVMREDPEAVRHSDLVPTLEAERERFARLIAQYRPDPASGGLAA